MLSITQPVLAADVVVVFSAIVVVFSAINNPTSFRLVNTIQVVVFVCYFRCVFSVLRNQWLQKINRMLFS